LRSACAASTKPAEPSANGLIDTETGTPRQRLLAIFDGAPVDRVRGCPFHNAAVEAAGAMRGVDDIVGADQLEFMERLIQPAGQAGANDP